MVPPLKRNDDARMLVPVHGQRRVGHHHRLPHLHVFIVELRED
jgi:hypothetical protein